MNDHEPDRRRGVHPARRTVLLGALVPVVGASVFGASRLMPAREDVPAQPSPVETLDPQPAVQVGPILDAADHGVLPGRNVSAALAQLLDDTSNAGGGIVAVTREGTYTVESCVLASKVTLRLGDGVRLRLPDRSSARAMLLLPDGGRSIAIEGPGVLDGNRDAYRGDAVNGGDILYADNEGTTTRGLRVENVRFVNAPRSAINTGFGVSDVLVTRCSFASVTLHAVISYNGPKVRWIANQATRADDEIAPNTPTFQFWVNPGRKVAGPVVQRNRIIGKRGTGAENAFIGIELHADGSGSMLGALVEDNTVQDGSMGVSVAGCDDVVVRGNTVTGSDYCGYEVASGSGVRIVDNTYDGKGRGTGVRLNDRPSDVTVARNVLRNWADEYSDAGVHCNADRLTGGSIRSNTLRGAYSRSSPLYLANASNLTVSGNDIAVRVTGGGLYYIDVRAQSSDCSNNRITGNVLTGRPGDFWTNGMVSIAVDPGRKAAGNVISGNRLTVTSGASGYGVSLTAAEDGGVSGTTVAQNRLSGSFTAPLRQLNARSTSTS